MKLLRAFWIVFFGLGVAFNAMAGDIRQDLIGTWLGIDDEGVRGGFVFRADGSADMIRNGVSFQETVIKDQGKITFRVDDSVTPIHLDLVVTRTNGKEQVLASIMQFIDSDTLKIRQPNGGPRPKDFTHAAANEVIVLQREKPKK